MKQYKIFVNPQGKYEAVKQGWSWPAFFFSSIWAIVKKMWELGVGVIFVFCVLGFIIGVSGGAGEGSNAFINISSIIVSLVFGKYGNKWRENDLPLRGYEYKETITATTTEESIMLYLKKNGEC